MFELVPQYSEEEEARYELIARVTQVVIVTLPLWMILLYCCIGKAINKIWILNNAVQFIVYIGLWKINVSRLLEYVLLELKKITL